jgi:cell division protease FtsH
MQKNKKYIIFLSFFLIAPVLMAFSRPGDGDDYEEENNYIFEEEVMPQRGTPAPLNFEYHMPKSIKQTRQPRPFSHAIKNLASWEKVILPERTKQSLYRHADYILHANEAGTIPNCICLYGTPGTAKTEIASSLASAMDTPLVIFSPSGSPEESKNLSIDYLIDQIKIEEDYILYIKNIEKMPKALLYSILNFKRKNTRKNNVLVLLSCNFDYIMHNLNIYCNPDIKTYIIDPIREKDLFEKVVTLTLEREGIISHDCDIDFLRIFSICKEFVQKDIELSVLNAIQKKKIECQENNYLLTIKTEDLIESIKEIKRLKLLTSPSDVGQIPINEGIKSESEKNFLSSSISFSYFIGYTELKEKMQETITYLKTPEVFDRNGIERPRSLLFVGTPGCGKTYMARAIAGEANVKILVVPCSTVLGKYIGDGSRTIQEIFQTAKLQAPCIIFFDEIDAITMQRRSSPDGAASEERRVIAALLAELDGVESNNNQVVVIGATNEDYRLLDPALIRRFGKNNIFTFSLPRYHTRIALINFFVNQGKNFHLDVNTIPIETIAMKTDKFSPDAIKLVINRAKYLALKRASLRPFENGDATCLVEKGYLIIDEDINIALREYNSGTRIIDHNIPEQQLYETAIHELGHAITALSAGENYPYNFDYITVDPFNHGESMVSLGHAMYYGKEDFHSLTKDELEAKIISALGGKVAEEVIGGIVTTGPSNDLEKATRIAIKMVTCFGMDANLFSQEGEKLSEEQRKAVESILQRCKERCITIIEEKAPLIKYLAHHLIEKKIIYKKELLQLISDYHAGVPL